MYSKYMSKLSGFMKIPLKSSFCQNLQHGHGNASSVSVFCNHRHLSFSVTPNVLGRKGLTRMITGGQICQSYQPYSTASTSGDLGTETVKDQSISTLKTMHRTLEDHHMRLLKDPDQPQDAQSLKVAIVGAPNAGKSTLTNALLGWRVSSVSSKVHTTRSRINVVLTEMNKQIIFLDTPGMVHPSKRKKHNLEHSLIRDPYSSLYQADIIAVIVDVSVPWVSAGLDKQILKALSIHEDKTAILVLNKVDLLKSKHKLLQLTRLLTEGVIDGTRDSFVAKATTKKRIKQILEEESTNELLQKHMPQGRIQKNIDSENENEEEKDNILLKEDQQGDHTETSDLNDQETVSGSDESSDKSDLWNVGGIFRGQKVVSAMPEGKSRRNAMPAMELRSWDEYAQALKRAQENVKDRRGWDQFKQVFMVSSTEHDGVEDLKDYLLDQATPGDWLYHSSVVTDQTPVDIIRHCIWEKLLDHLPNDIPYNLDLELEMVVEEGSMFRIAVNVICPSERHMRFTMGRGGRNIALVAAEAKQALMNTFKCDLSLMLVAKLRR
ncbi:GTPase Era, mitochondrial-like [Lineus longissimus]|uniref:GTPase Era, mitochondrial-like n=1 Tax=Lineus longissimus TaxID=88925 RepID=UPI002B4C9D4A